VNDDSISSAKKGDSGDVDDLADDLDTGDVKEEGDEDCSPLVEEEEDDDDDDDDSRWWWLPKRSWKRRILGVISTTGLLSVGLFVVLIIPALLRL
tara:strand:- start:395 stop:679 length:285 start_codon:yes stop_codon:yes gene_type:complete